MSCPIKRNDPFDGVITSDRNIKAEADKVRVTAQRGTNVAQTVWDVNKLTATRIRPIADDEP